MRASPEVGCTRPRSMPIVVVLPEPFGPRNPNTPPRGTRSVRRSTATTSPYCFVRSVVSMTLPSGAATRAFSLLASIAITPTTLPATRSAHESRAYHSDDLLQLPDLEEIGRGEIDKSADRRRQDRLQREHELWGVDEEIEGQVRHADEPEHGDAHQKARAELFKGFDAQTNEPQASARREQDEQERGFEERRDRVRKREAVDLHERRQRHAEHDVQADRYERECERGLRVAR